MLKGLTCHVELLSRFERIQRWAGAPSLALARH
jgi:hypothetical protein